jgi:hypothetical protein
MLGMKALDQDYDGIIQVDRLKSGRSLLSFELRHDLWHRPCQGRVKCFLAEPEFIAS